MKAEEVIRTFREEAHDTVLPFLWSDALVMSYLDQAQNEAARRSRCLRDASTAAVCSYRIIAGNPFVKLHASVIQANYVEVQYADVEADPQTTTHCELKGRTTRDMEMVDADWRHCTGAPRYFLMDVETGKMRLDKIPTRDAVLKIECARLPLKCLREPEDCIEIPDKYAPDLIYWMLFRAYSKKDSDTQDEGLAATNLAIFESIFGKRSSAIDEQWHAHLSKTPRRTRFY